jgi:hypothetical protein
VEDLNMQAHRVRVTIPENHKVTIEVPTEVPTGEAEVIVLSSIPAPHAATADTSFATRFRPDPALGPIVFHEDPTAPVSEEDWPSDQRP